MEPTTNSSAAAAAPAYDRLNVLPRDIQRRVFSFMPAQAVGNLQSASATNRQWQLRVSAFEKKCGIDPTVCEHLQIGKDLHLQMKASYELLSQLESKIQEIAQTAVAQHLSAPDSLNPWHSANLCGLLVHAGFVPQAIEKASSLEYDYAKDVAFLAIVKALSEIGNIAEAKKQAAFINSYIKNEAASNIAKAQLTLHDISGAKETVRNAAANTTTESSPDLDESRHSIVFLEASNGDFAAAEETLDSIRSPGEKRVARATIERFRDFGNTDKHVNAMEKLIRAKGRLQKQLVRTSSTEEFPRGRVVEYGAIPKSLLNDLSRFKEALRELYGK